MQDYQLSDHFWASEFWCRGQDQGTCNCHHSLTINPILIDLLEQLRADIGGYPLIINSGYRCPDHNWAVGGAQFSQHTLGNAADVACPDNLTMPEFLWYCQQLPFDGIGYYWRGSRKGPDGGWIHNDVRNNGVRAGAFWEG